MGVMLFFTLSAFLMTILYFERVPEKGNLTSFWVARFSRIYPLHFLLLSIALGAFYIGANPVIFPYAINMGTYLENIFLVGRFNVFWTISTEFQFYLVFTVLWVLAYKSSKPKTIMAAVSILACFAVFLDIYAYPPGPVYKTIHFFAVGILAGLLFITFDFRRYSISADKFLALLLVLFLASLPAPYEFLTGRTFTGFWSPWLLILCFLIIFMCSISNGFVAKMLGSKTGIFLGNLSFAIYLTHVPVQHLTKHVFQGQAMFLQFGIVLLVTFLLSSLIYYLFEEPFRLFLRKQMGLKEAPLVDPKTI